VAEVEAEIVCQHVLVEDVVEQLAIAGPEHDRVVGDVFVPALGAEVPDEQAHRVASGVDATVGPVRARVLGEEVSIREGRVGVGDHEVGGDPLAVVQHDPHRALLAEPDPGDLRAEP
jgi:hypothetical protein